jgi:uncharacterized protein (TIGR03000 family)
MKRKLLPCVVVLLASGALVVLTETVANAGGRTGQQVQFRPSSSDSSVPSSPVYAPSYSQPALSTYQSYFQGPASATSAVNAAQLRIRLPKNAQLWIEDQDTSPRGADRAFVSPPLPAGRDFVYHLKTQWTENGQQVTRTREVPIHAGDVVNIDFLGGR